MFRPRGHRVVAGVGLFLLFAAVVHHGTEIGSVAGAAGPLLALALDGGIAVGVVYAGSRIAAPEFAPAEEHRIARWTVVGSLTAVVAIGATFLVRVFEGRPLVEPAFPLLVAAGAGALGGTVAGRYAVRSAAEARRARDATRAVAFVNHLLRHDLRNDLSTIRGYADLVDEEEDSDADAAEGVPGADSRSDSPSSPPSVIARKADEGIDRIEATGAVADALLGRADLRRVDLAETTRDVLAGVADHSGVTVDADVAETAPVRANEGLRSVVDNLVENAIEHTGPGATLRVAVVDEDDRVTLTVGDDGPGIPPERRDSLLGEDGDRDDADGLDRGDGAPDGGDTGDDAVGGLRIVSTLVDRYGGGLSIGESDLGGARIEVTLPRAEPRREA